MTRPYIGGLTLTARTDRRNRRRSDRSNIQRQSMNPSHQLLPQRLVDRPVPLHPGHIRKGLRANAHVEMALATFLIPGMAAMAFAVVHNLQVNR